MKKYPYLVFYKVDDTKREIIIKAGFHSAYTIQILYDLIHFQQN